MPWYVPWSENIKKRACRYLLQRYLGQFLEEKLTLDQLSVDLYNGTGTVSNVSLDCEALNELGETQGWPLEFVDGYVKKMNVSIPWATLLKDDSFVEVEGLTVTVQPKQRSESATSMLESMWSSMTSSMQLAAECLKQETDNSQPPQPVEGIELFAQTIDSILCRVKVKFTNTTVRMEHVPKDSNTGVALEIHIQHIDYLDEAGSDPPTELSDTEKSKTYVVSTFTTKRISFQGITFHTDEFPSKARTFAKSIILESTHKTKSNTSDEEATPNQETNYSSLYESCSLNSPQENWENDLNKIIKDVNLAENYNLIGDVGKSDREEFSKAMGGSNPILFGKMAGRQELRLKLKQSEEALGPHVDLQLTLGSLTLFLSPRQLHVLLELANGLASPHLEDNSNVPLRTHPGMESKPMQRLDFERVEAQLMGGLGAGRAPHSLSSRHGWSTANIDDSDEEDEKFLPLTSRRSAGVTPSGMSDSFCSSGSMSSSITSTASSLGGLQANRRRRAPPIEGDPAADVSQVHIRISSFACVLLHEDILTLSGSACGGVSASSVQQMQAASSAFFSRLGLFAVGGYGSQDMEQASKAFHEAVSFNHIRLLAAPVVLEGREKSSAHGSCISGQLTTARLDLRECLTNLSVPLLVFHNESQKESEKSGQDPMLNPLGKTPDVKVTFKHTQKAGKTTAERKYTQPKTEISVVMEPCTMEVDISLVDRLCAVLNPLPLCQTSSTQPATEAEPSTSPQQAMELSVTCPQLKVKLRFPIADLRPAHDMSRLAWWQRGVRPDLLLVLLQQVSLHSLPQQPEHSYRIQCRQLDLLYCPDCETDTEIHIGRATADDSTCSDPNAASPTISWPSITITVLSPLESAGGLLESSSDGEAAGGGGTMGQSSAMLLDRLNSCPGPFSSKKMVHESDTPHSKTNQDDTEELVIPADSAEMSEFVEVAMKNSLLQIVCDLPTVSLQLGSKHLYEVLYNRINCDLLLWEPSAPRPGQHTRPSPADMHDSMYPAFSMCKSAINYDSDSGSSSSSTDSNVYYSVYDPRARQHTRSRSGKGGGAGGGTRPRRTRHNNFGFHLKIHKGLLTMYTPVRDSVNHVLPGQQGEIVISVETLSVCHIGGVAGDVRDALVSVTGANAHLYHCGLVPLSTEKMPLRLHGRSLPDHLKDTIYPSGKGVCMKQGGNPSRDMISVAISIKPNKDYPSFKTIKVSAGISNATLRHSMSPSQHSWLSQLLDMMDVEEYPVLGLQPGTVLTELHVHLWDAAIDYRPLHLPLRTVVTLGSFSISSNVVAQTEASNLRFIAEECALFLASGLPSSTREVDLRRDYVCVIDLGLLELSTRLNDKNIKTAPRVDLRASNNMVNIRTCSDSFRALCRLIDYLAGDGDLAEAPAPPGTPPHSDTDMPEELITMSERVPEEIRDLSQSQVQHVNQLMEEAMKESVSLDDLTGSDTNAVGSGVEVFFFPDEGLAGLGSPSQDVEALPLLEAAQEAVSALEGQEPMPQVQRELGDYRQTGKEKSPAASQKSKARKKSSSDNTDDEFCIVGEECVGKSSGGAPAEPAVRWLTEEPVNVIDNHFTLPVGKTDQLKPPKNFPMPVLRYTLCEMTLVWHMYGGQDFRTPADPETGKPGAGGSPAAGGAAPTRSSSLGPHRKTVTISDDTHSPTFQRRDRDPYNVVPGSPSTSYGSLGNGGVHYRRGAEGVTHSTAPPGSPREPPWRHKGGPQRRHDVLMELQLNKVRFQHELYPAGGAEASRQVLIVAAVEVRDRLASSQINKFLYQYTSEQRPARKHANMLVVKAVHLRPEPRLGVQECCLKVSLLPLRFNIDQDALLFLVAFFSESDQAIDSSLKTTDSGSTQSLHSLGGGSSRHSTPTHAPPVMSVTPSLLQRRSSCTSTSTSQLNMLSSCASSLEDSHSPRADDNEALLNSFEAERLVSENLILLEEDCLGGRGAAGGAAGRGSREPDTASLRSQTSRGSEPPADDAPIYFRNVVFSPEVPIRLDYQGKRVDLTHGPLAGLLMGLGQLNCSELRLKSLSYRHGLLGVERLVRWALQEWLGDIKRHQLPGLLGGVGPMHSLVQLFQGIRDLFWLPIEQYQRDGRLVRGLQRGASSFTTSTAMAALDITARIIQLIQATAETAYDMVSPSPGLRGVRGRGRRRRERPREPQDIREGVANAYHLVREGLGETAQALADVAVAERSARGYSGAVGGVLRQLPPTALAPLLLASAAANRVLGGVRAHLAPHQRKDQQDKWRQHNTNNS